MDRLLSTGPGTRQILSGMIGRAKGPRNDESARAFRRPFGAVDGKQTEPTDGRTDSPTTDR